MISNERITLIIRPANKKFWETKLNFPLSVGEEIVVSVFDLPAKSNILIDCLCDKCNRKYQQRRSRNLSVCGYCQTKERMQNNTLGSKNRKYDIPKKGELENLIFTMQYGKQKLAKHYGVSIPVVNRWIVHHDIQIDAYYGRKYFKSEQDYNKAKILIEQSLNGNIDSKSQLSKETQIPRHIINKLETESDLSFPNKFTKMNDSYQKILSSMQHYESENKTKTLKQIAEENLISIEQLKKAFRDSNTKVKSHSYNKSKGELECRDFIRGLNVKCDSYMFNKTYEIDCFVPSAMFGLEYCGEYWHKYTPIKNNKNYHIDKFKYFRENGIKLMTIFESEWKNPIKQDILKSMIMSRLKHTDIIKVGARKCTISFIDRKVAADFHKHNHISGSTMSTCDIGLSHQGVLVAVLSLVKSRFDKSYEYEISRFSSKLRHNIPGGFSRLFRFAVENIGFNSCITYADLRFGEGDVYKNNGFIFLKTTIPNYLIKM
jgi:hypothetical protein